MRALNWRFHIVSKLRAAVVGATGLAGQQFLASLAGHPLFEARPKLVASPRSAGKKYADAIKDDKRRSSWYCSEPLSDRSSPSLVVEDAAHMTPGRRRRGVHRRRDRRRAELEPRYAANVPVISTASAFRYEPDVPVFLARREPATTPRSSTCSARSAAGRASSRPGPNCTTVGLAHHAEAAATTRSA